MIITLFGLFFLILCAIIGYSLGLYRILALLIAFLLSSLLAKPFSLLFVIIIQSTNKVPLALISITSQLFTGLVIFIILNSFFKRTLTSNEIGREQLNLPKISLFQNYFGAIIGCIWGGFFLVCAMTALHLSANIHDTLLYRTTQLDNTSSSKVSEILGTIKEQIEESVLGDLVIQLDPVDDKVQQIFEDLSKIATTPHLHQNFKNHPAASRLAGIPVILELSQDPVIQYQIQNSQFYDLLDNPKILALVNNDEFYYELKHIDTGVILQEVINNEYYY